MRSTWPSAPTQWTPTTRPDEDPQCNDDRRWCSVGNRRSRRVHIPVDRNFRLDTQALRDQIRELTRRRVPIMACITVCGTTEESAVDQLDEVLAVRDRAESELGVTFHIHSDACYGGYAASGTWNADGIRRTGAEIRASSGGVWPSDNWVRAMSALANADSVTIDPHLAAPAPAPDHVSGFIAALRSACEATI